MVVDLRRAVPVVALATLLGGCAGSGSGAGTPSAPAPVPSTPAAGSPTGGAASPAASEATSPAASPAPTTIPVSAFFAVPENMRTDGVRRPAEAGNALPRLCGEEFARRGETAASASVLTVYTTPDADAGTVPHGVVYQTIRTYPGAGAAAFMSRLRDDLAACRSFRRDGVAFTVRTDELTGIGDEAVALDLVQPQLDLPGNPTGGDQVNRVVTIRVGDVVTVVRDAEYERSSSIPSIVDDFARWAVEAIRTWRD